MKCLVTGGAGFIGSNLVDRLIKDGHEVICIDNESAITSEQFYWNSSAKNYKLDIRDSDCDDLYKDVDYVFHLAAESRIQPAIENPEHAISVNCVGTCKVMQFARKHKVKRVIYSSTSSAYGLTDICPQKENFPEDCLNPYSVSKIAGEKICKMYWDLFGVETISFRYFNVYGERSPVNGQYAPVIGIFLNQMKNNIPLTVVGSGENRRDFVHVHDVVEANILAMEKNISIQNIGQVYNVGFGENFSINEIAKMISNNIIHIPERLGEAKTTLCDYTKIKNTLGWIPKIKVNEWIKQQIMENSI
jgi:UDP-glucose 4-epimerase